jgi:two-component system chemotaxis response regulator CheB
MIKVLIADDSPTCRILMRRLLCQHEDIQIVAEAKDGAEAVSLTARLRPDIVVMDLVMPVLDGILATVEIMATTPTPIVIVSSTQSIHEASTAMKALTAGALSLIDKPAMSPDPAVFAEAVSEFSRTIRLMSAVKVIKHNKKANESGLGVAIAKAGAGRFASRSDSIQTLQGEQLLFNPSRADSAAVGMTGAYSTGAFSPINAKSSLLPGAANAEAGIAGCDWPMPHTRPRVIAIASSTGGPPALWQITQTLPANYPIPILVVQHIGRGFVEGMVSWLNRGGGAGVKVAQAGEVMLPGVVYVAPDDLQMGTSSDGRVQLSKTPAIGGFRPSATFLFESVASSFNGDVVAVVLTGMGDDGAASLCHIKRRGGMVLAQDKPSCIVYGMPAAAVETGYTDLVLPLAQIPAYLKLLGEI